MPTVSDSAVIGDYDTIRRTLERAVHHNSFSSVAFIDLRGGIVQAERTDPPEVRAPDWLLKVFTERLMDSNRPVSVGGKDYGVLRLRFAHDRIAGGLWQQTRTALGLALAALALGAVLMRALLGRWLGNFNRIKSLEVAMEGGGLDPLLLSPQDAQQAPTEFRDTFEVLGRAAANLQAQRAQAAVTLGAIADGVITLDAQGRVLLANPAASQMAGQPADSMLGKTIEQLAPQLPVPRHDGRLKPWTSQRVTVGAHGHELTLDTTLSPILAPDGGTAGYVLACRDVTEQHGLEQRLRAELQAREAALVTLRQLLESLPHQAGSDRVVNGAAEGAAEGVAADTDDLSAITAMISQLVLRLQMRGEQLDAIFALSPDGFVSFDAQRCANYVSPAYTRLTGQPAARVLGASEAEIESLLRAQCHNAATWSGLVPLRERTRERMFEGTREQNPSNERVADQIELLRPTRRVLEVGLRLGSTAGISQVLSLRDVTHESEVDQMKSEFLSTAAHEMRTPMASIFGFVELLLNRQMKPERQREMLETIHRQSQLMINIVNELLDLARIEARRGSDFVLETVDLQVLVRNVVHDFRPPQERDSPALSGLSAPVWVNVDLNKMSQALGNVLSNAYKYSPAGGPVRVRLVAGAVLAGVPPQVGIEVSDRGIGMTPEQLSRVSERFYRADASGNIPGTGLGMSIVKEITELLGGRLALASEPGQGTVVTLWLPVAPTRPAELPLTLETA
jgi:PAS domain S-box-containing protein